MSKLAGKPRRIVVFGPFDGTNLGNEATLQAALYHFHRIQPDAKLICVCTGARATAATYDIRAIPICRTYISFWTPPRNWLGKTARTLCLVLGEPIRWLEGFLTLWGTDLFIVPGTGLLTDAYGLTSWGPYSLLRWSVIAKLCLCRVAVVSVGAGPFHSLKGKLCVRMLLSLADFRSYRDESTVRCLQRIGIQADRDRVFPDLAFSLPKEATTGDSRLGPGAVIGLGVMEWANRYSKHGSNEAAQMAYLQAVAKMAGWLLERGYKIRLLIGDFSDGGAKQAFLQMLGQRNSECIIDEPIHSVEDLLSQIVATDAVLATRFHNVLLALLCERPVISISFHYKCDSLMAAMGMSEYCLNSGDVEAEKLIETFRRLEANADALKPLIKEKIKRFRDALDQQYRLVLGGTHGGSWTTLTTRAPR